MASKLDLSLLNQLMQKMANDKKIFQNEAQFQFDLAWEIRNALEKDDYKVFLEVWTSSEQKTNKKNKQYNKKFYTDIVVSHPTEKDVAIELKYKTKNLNCDNNKVDLKSHLAFDFGRYDFLYDVKRNENLVISKQCRKHFDFIKGYAIFLTNESSYWNNKSQKNMDAEFVLGIIKNDNVYIKNGDKKWKDITDNVFNSWRRDIIHLDNTYNNTKWEDYKPCGSCNTCNENKEFKYLILETK